MERREIKRHRVGHLNKKLRIFVCDDVTPDGLDLYTIEDDGAPIYTIQFGRYIVPKQTGLLTIESLLAIVEDRLSMMNAEPYGRRETSIAITKIQEAMMFLQKPIRDIEMDSE